MKQDVQISDLIRKEEERQSEGIELIASENFVSNQVLEALGSVCTNKYAEGYLIVSVEQADDATMLQDFQPEPGKRYALVFGNEVKGVAQEVVDASDLCLEIPQYGTKHSLNVSVSIGIVLWSIILNNFR